MLEAIYAYVVNSPFCGGVAVWPHPYVAVRLRIEVRQTCTKFEDKKVEERKDLSLFMVISKLSSDKYLCFPARSACVCNRNLLVGRGGAPV
jgi:hypothetical protein